MRADGGRELLKELAAAGVKVWADAGDLAYEGPEDTITPEILELLSDHKEELVKMLEKQLRPEYGALATVTEMRR